MKGDGAEAPPPSRVLLSAACNGVAGDLKLDIRIAECGDLNEGRAREIACEELLASAPDFFVVGHVGHIDRHGNNILQAGPGCLEAVLDLLEDDLGLFVGRTNAVNRLKICAPRGEPRQPDLITYADRI